MIKRTKVKKQRVQSVRMNFLRTRLSSYWQPVPFDKKGKFIPSSVDCLFNQDYYKEGEASDMLRSL